MRTLIQCGTLILFLILSKAEAQQASLQLTTFNSLTGAHSTIGPIVGADSLFGMNQQILHASARSAIAPERDFYTFIGKSGSGAFELKTVDLNTAGLVYSTPVNFINAQGLASAFNEFHYADTLGELVGIYTDSAGANLVRCNLQTGAIGQITAVKTGGPKVTAYSHTREVYYYINAEDTFLYAVDPVTGHQDSLDLQFKSTQPLIFGGYEYSLVGDMQFDDLNDRLLAVVRSLEIGQDAVVVIEINITTGQLTELYSRIIDPMYLSTRFYPWSFDATNSRYLYQFQPNLTATPLLVSANVVSSGDTMFNVDSIFSLNQVITNFQYNYLTGKIYALGVNFDSVTISTPPYIPRQDICKVTTDSASTHCIVIWEKSDKAATDSFRIYREVSTNQYLLIASVHHDSLSEYHDYDAKPRTMAYRYKMSVLDTAGREGALSDFHNTLYLQYSGGGNLIWTAYSIGSSSPVTTYNIYRDSLGDGNWVLLASVPGTQYAYTDIDFENHTNALYRIEGNFPFSCIPTRSASTILSNIASSQPLGTKTLNSNNFIIYPNPSSGRVNILTTQQMSGAIITIRNVEGRLMCNLWPQTNTPALSTNLPDGIYFVTVTNNGLSYTRKLIVNH